MSKTCCVLTSDEVVALEDHGVRPLCSSGRHGHPKRSEVERQIDSGDLAWCSGYQGRFAKRMRKLPVSAATKTGALTHKDMLTAVGIPAALPHLDQYVSRQAEAATRAKISVYRDIGTMNPAKRKRVRELNSR